MLKKDCQAGTKAQQRTNDEVTTSSHTIGKPNVVRSPNVVSLKDNDDIWSHPMNKGVPQKNIQHFETVKAYLENCPTDENGNKRINEQEFVNLMNSFEGCVLSANEYGRFVFDENGKVTGCE